jgi:hypothetical protein
MDQYVSWKAEGLFWTNSWQVPACEAQELLPQTLPAQSPQNVVSKTWQDCERKFEKDHSSNTHNLLVAEETINVTRSGEHGRRITPSRWIGFAA